MNAEKNRIVHYIEVLQSVVDLPSADRHLLIIDLLEKDKINFEDLSTAYVNKLRNDRQELQREIMPLVLWLAQAADGHLKREEIEEHIYKKGYLSDSKYGEKLKEKYEKVKNERNATAGDL